MREDRERDREAAERQDEGERADDGREPQAEAESMEARVHSWTAVSRRVERR
jgi:hypothetical protein